MYDVIQLIVFILGSLLILISLLPLIRHDYWTFRVFEFPRAQKWVINALLLVISLWFVSFIELFDMIYLTLLAANFAYLTYQVFPYLPFISKKQIDSVNRDLKPNFSLLVANVYQYNQQWQKLAELVNQNNPDVVLLLETNKFWKDHCISSFGDSYAFKLLEDRENTYGMLIFSKLKLSDSKVHYLIKDDIPSIETNIELGGHSIKFYAIHPEPPVPSENPKSTARDAEILKVGKKAKLETQPVIIAGDLNDVAWSYTTDLFLKTSGLLDPRRGRGFYSTFHAKYAFARWPLDHIFCSGQFRLQKLKRLKNIGSDHFPMLIQLHLADVKDDSGRLQNSEEENELRDEKIEEAE